MKLSKFLAWLSWRSFKNWPKRRVRPVVRLLITNDQRNHPRCINDLIRQRGYTSGDRVVLLLEKDFDRLADLANSKVRNPIMEMSQWMLHDAFLEKINR